MKVGFKVSKESDAEEPVIGSAETGESEEYEWFDFLFPKVVDFLMVFGALSLVRDVVDYILKRK